MPTFREIFPLDLGRKRRNIYPCPPRFLQIRYFYHNLMGRICPPQIVRPSYGPVMYYTDGWCLTEMTFANSLVTAKKEVLTATCRTQLSQTIFKIAWFLHVIFFLKIIYSEKASKISKLFSTLYSNVKTTLEILSNLWPCQNIWTLL